MKDDFTGKTSDIEKERERKERSQETERCRARGKKSLTQRKSYIEKFGSKEREEGREGGRDSKNVKEVFFPFDFVLQRKRERER